MSKKQLSVSVRERSGVLLLLAACSAACSSAGTSDRSPSSNTTSGDQTVSSNDEVEPQASSPFPKVVAGEERVKQVGEGGLPNRVLRRVRAEANTSLDSTQRNLGTVFGVYSELGHVGRYSWVVENQPSYETPVPKGDEALALPALAQPVLTRAVTDRLTRASARELVPVVVTLRDRLTTPLRNMDLSALTQLSTDAGASKAELHAQRAERIAQREAEAKSKQLGLRSWLNRQGVSDSNIGSFWAVNALSLRVPAALVQALAAHPDVARVELDRDLTSTGSTTWDGENVKQSNGLNAGLFINNGNLGDRVNPKFGFPISIGVLDFFFDDTHPVFQHSPGVSKIVGEFSCKNNTACVGGLPTPGPSDDVHGSWCASAAAAAARNGQIGGTAADQLDRTGVAEQSELTFVSTGAISDTIRGLQTAVGWDADVVTESFGGGDGVCDGFNSGWEQAVYAAHQAGVLVVGSAGNDGHPGTCKLTGLSEVPSQFVVGALDDPGSGSYATSTLASYSSGGGINVTIGGSTFTQALSGVDAVVPGRWAFAAGKSGTFNDVGGTSFSAPQAAGVAALFKDWMISIGLSDQSNYPGVLFTNLLAMTDRQGASGKRTSGFDPAWGGGRLQSRLYSVVDHPSGLWRWEFASYQVSNGAHVQHLVAGAGNEPFGINTFKVYAVFFEQDGSDIADIDMTVYDHGCGTGRVALGSDVSRDVKSMVSIGSAGAGKDVCVDLYGFHVPPGETRDVILVAYYTDETSLR